MLSEQTALLEDIYKGLYDEYTIRRKMLVERAKVTLDSQLRSKQLEDRGTQEEARRVAEQGSARMTSEPLVTLQNVYQACQGRRTFTPSSLNGPCRLDHSQCPAVSLHVWILQPIPTSCRSHSVI